MWVRCIALLLIDGSTAVHSWKGGPWPKIKGPWLQVFRQTVASHSSDMTVMFQDHHSICSREYKIYSYRKIKEDSFFPQ